MTRSYRASWISAAKLALLLLVPHILPWHKTPPQVVDPEMAQAGEALFKNEAQAGEVLFNHEWQPNDPLAAGGDGLGPVYNASSCVACHHQGGPGGGGGLDHNVTKFIVLDRRGRVTREGVVHAHGVGFQETLQDIDPALPPFSQPSLIQLETLQRTSEFRNREILIQKEIRLSQRNTPALFGARLIDELPEEVIVNNEKDQRIARATSPRPQEVPVGRALRLTDGRVGRFGSKAQTASLSDFVQAACANELGLGNPGHPQPRPLSIPDYPERGLDLTKDQCDQITAFVASLPRPVERLPKSIEAQGIAGAVLRSSGIEIRIPGAILGKQLFVTTGCADCHTPKLGPIEGIYSDLLLHDMGEELGADGSYGRSENGRPGDGSPSPGEWRTPPLWGVADSAPYLHDGRAATLELAIHLHGGTGRLAARQFKGLGADDQQSLVAFLKTLRAP